MENSNNLLAIPNQSKKFSTCSILKTEILSFEDSKYSNDVSFESTFSKNLETKRPHFKIAIDLLENVNDPNDSSKKIISRDNQTQNNYLQSSDIIKLDSKSSYNSEITRDILMVLVCFFTVIGFTYSLYFVQISINLL